MTGNSLFYPSDFRYQRPNKSDVLLFQLQPSSWNEAVGADRRKKPVSETNANIHEDFRWLSPNLPRFSLLHLNPSDYREKNYILNNFN